MPVRSMCLSRCSTEVSCVRMFSCCLRFDLARRRVGEGQHRLARRIGDVLRPAPRLGRLDMAVDIDREVLAGAAAGAGAMSGRMRGGRTARRTTWNMRPSSGSDSEDAEMLVQVGAILEPRAAGPAATTRPLLSIATSSATAKASLTFCSTSRIDRPSLLEAADRRHDLGDDLRRQAFRRLVHQQDARIRHERPADREHLLLAAGEIAGDLPLPLAEARKESRQTRASVQARRAATAARARRRSGSRAR